MKQFAQTFPDEEKVVTLSRNLSWSHFLILIPLETKEKRAYYAQQAIKEQLGVRGLKNK